MDTGTRRSGGERPRPSPLPAASSRGGSPQWSDSFSGAPCTPATRRDSHPLGLRVTVCVQNTAVAFPACPTLRPRPPAASDRPPPRCAPSPSRNSRPRSPARCWTSLARICRSAGRRGPARRERGAWEGSAAGVRAARTHDEVEGHGGWPSVASDHTNAALKMCTGPQRPPVRRVNLRGVRAMCQLASSLGELWGLWDGRGQSLRLEARPQRVEESLTGGLCILPPRGPVLLSRSSWNTLCGPQILIMAAAEAEPRPLSLLHKSVAAAGASVVSAFVVNPLDVVKVGCREISVAQGVLSGPGGGSRPPAPAAAAASRLPASRRCALLCSSIPC